MAKTLYPKNNVLGERLLRGLPRSFSGSDFKIWAYYPTPQSGVNVPASLDDGIIKLGTLQTITSSFAGSLAPVETIGYGEPVGFTTGQKTTAGTLVFTVLDREPLSDLLALAGTSYTNANPTFDTVDQLPPFNVVIEGDNEYVPLNGETKTTISKMIIGVRLHVHGETISIDDFYTEQTYQYQAQHVTPWITGGISVSRLLSPPGKTAITDPIVTSASETIRETTHTVTDDLQKLSAIKTQLLYPSL